jgi:Zn-dependent M16 (insulinase) family peptidase
MRKSAKVPLPMDVCHGEQELISKAKNLASNMGIIVSGNTPLEQILTVISDKIEKGGHDEFKPEFGALKEAYETVKKNENAMFASMNYNASINKMMLGL